MVSTLCNIKQICATLKVWAPGHAAGLWCYSLFFSLHMPLICWLKLLSCINANVYLLTNYTYILLRAHAICWYVYWILCIAVLADFTITMFFNRSENPTTGPSPWGSKPQSNTWFLWLTRVHNPNSKSINSDMFVGLTAVSNRHTDRPHRNSLLRLMTLLNL